MKKRKVVIRKTLDRGKGVFAKDVIRKGETVVSGRVIREIKMRTNYSFQVGPNFHVQLDIVSRSINHSCEPSTGIRNNVFGAYDFIALRDIQKGEEITWDYETTEYISISIKNCLCGSKTCKKELHGFKYLPISTILKYNGFIADYLKEILIQNLQLRDTSKRYASLEL